MARVVVVRDDDEVFAVALEHVRTNGPVAVSGEIDLIWTGEQASVLDQRETARGRAIGSVEAVKTAAGKRTPLVHDVTFAFVAHAFHPDVAILGITSP